MGLSLFLVTIEKMVPTVRKSRVRFLVAPAIATAEQLVGYAGLGARIRASGNVQHTGKITKQGRRELRTGLVTVA
jgi:transposase